MFVSKYKIYTRNFTAEFYGKDEDDALRQFRSEFGNTEKIETIRFLGREIVNKHTSTKGQERR